MIRMIRAQIALFSAVSLLALGAATMLSTAVAVSAPAHASKKVKKHKKNKKKKAAKRVASVKITAGNETLAFNTQATQALEKAKVSLAAVGPATGALASGFVFPLAGGTLNPSTGYGSLTTTGGITLSTSFSVPGLFSSGSEATISEPSLTLGSSSSLSFTSQQASPPTFPFASVSLKGVRPVVGGATITLTNLPVSLTATGVQFLGGFASGAFTTGEAVGTITVQVTASS
ncbi:MAG: HtaA domain-containing protein [Solirubrobacteraceae bacterium]